MITSRPATNRDSAILWLFFRRPDLEGFESYTEKAEWTHKVLDGSDLHEEWIFKDDERVGYFAYQDGYCIHHKGKLLDIQMLVLAPHSRDTRKVWKEILRVAKSGGYSWVARRQHQPDGSISTIFTEV